MQKKSNQKQLTYQELLERRERQRKGSSDGGKKSWDPKRVPEGVSKIRLAKMKYFSLKRVNEERARSWMVGKFNETIAQKLINKWEDR